MLVYTYVSTLYLQLIDNTKIILITLACNRDGVAMLNGLSKMIDEFNGVKVNNYNEIDEYESVAFSLFSNINQSACSTVD